MAKVISHRTVEAPSRPTEGRATKADGLVPGLQFIVHAGGKKSLPPARAHPRQAGQPRDRRRLADDAGRRPRQGQGPSSAAIANGEDPREAKREAIKSASETVEVVADGIHRASRQGPQPATWEETERFESRRSCRAGAGGPSPPSTSADVVALLDVIVDRGCAGDRPTGCSPRRARCSTGRASAALIETSPFDRRQGAGPGDSARPRPYLISELALILQAADRLGYPFRAVRQAR